MSHIASVQEAIWCRSYFGSITIQNKIGIRSLLVRFEVADVRSLEADLLF